MLTIQGQFNQAKVFTNHIEQEAIEQIKQLCDQPFTAGSKIRIMPDVHAGAGCTIGTTMTINDKIIPNLVGVDIGCGMTVLQLKNTSLELGKLDQEIIRAIPSGFQIRKTAHNLSKNIKLEQLRATKAVNNNRGYLSIGTLGGGNHFIEVNEDDEGTLYLVVHSGSRHIGLEIAQYYQNEGVSRLSPSEKSIIPKSLAYIQGDLFADYLHDMSIIQQYAQLNRQAMLDQLIRGLNLKVDEQFSTIHNYIDLQSMILRKGAVSAQKGEKLLIPLNMKDGSLVCIGKGNDDWNYSAPHGAGRIMSRTAAKNSLNINEFKDMMKGIYSTSVSKKTIDEAPLAYRPMEQITNFINDTVSIHKHIRPIYNFKASN